MIDIDRKLESLKELMDRGEPGEQKIAKKLFYGLLKKYNISECGIGKDVRKHYFFKYKNKFEYDILFHIVAKIQNKRRVTPWTKQGKRLLIGYELTPAEHINVSELFEVYRAAFLNETNDLLSAFILKHEIFPKAKEEEKVYFKPSFTENDEKIFKMVGNLPPIEIKKYLKKG